MSPPVPNQEPSARRRVLLVDDEPAMLVLLDRLLRGDYEVVAVASAPEALTLLEAGQLFDVMVCDLMMPGMSGIELHGALKSTHPDLAAKMIFCSAGADSPQLRAFLDDTGNRFISKPFKMAQVRALVRELLSEPGAA